MNNRIDRSIHFTVGQVEQLPKRCRWSLRFSLLILTQDKHIFGARSSIFVRGSRCLSTPLSSSTPEESILRDINP
uniref:Uncharacterized protein n=1 Tax=Steinernema glaseri TaxID=37863 RepID=A0A1I7Y8C4_9BILA